MTLTKKRFAIGRWLHRRAENIEVALIATMFIGFLLQIAFRYFLNQPLGWTEEVTILCWMWGVLWGAAFIVSDEEEIRFDILYAAVPETVRRVFTVITGIALILLLAISLPATLSYVLFMKREHTAYLRIPLDYVSSIYIVFAIACMVKHGRLVWCALRGIKSTEADPAESVGQP